MKVYRCALTFRLRSQRIMVDFIKTFFRLQTLNYMCTTVSQKKKQAVEVYLLASRSDEVINESSAKIVLEIELRQSSIQSISEIKR